MYIDDILIFSHDHDDRRGHLSEVFAWRHHYGVIINKEKGVFGMTEIEFLGHVIYEDGVSSFKKKDCSSEPIPHASGHATTTTIFIDVYYSRLERPPPLLTQLLSSKTELPNYQLDV